MAIISPDNNKIRFAILLYSNLKGKLFLFVKDIFVNVAAVRIEQ